MSNHLDRETTLTDFRKEYYGQMKSRLLTAIERLTEDGEQVSLRKVAEKLGVSVGMLQNCAVYMDIIREARKRQINSRS